MSADDAARALVRVLRGEPDPPEWMLATVLTATPLTVRPESASATAVVGPIPFVRTRPSVNDQVVIVRPRGSDWVAIGRAAPPGRGLSVYDRTAPGVYGSAGGPDVTVVWQNANDVWAISRSANSWGAPKLTASGTTTTGPTGIAEVSDSGTNVLDARVTPLAPSDVPFGGTDLGEIAAFGGREGKVFRMSDGALAAIARTSSEPFSSPVDAGRTGIYAYVRTGGSWTRQLLLDDNFATDGIAKSWTLQGFKQVGDVVFFTYVNATVTRTAVLVRAAYSGGSFAVTTATVESGGASNQISEPAYDATNDFIHVLSTAVSTQHFKAFAASSLALQFTSSTFAPAGSPSTQHLGWYGGQLIAFLTDPGALNSNVYLLDTGALAYGALVGERCPISGAGGSGTRSMVVHPSGVITFLEWATPAVTIEVANSAVEQSATTARLIGPRLPLIYITTSNLDLSNNFESYVDVP